MLRASAASTSRAVRRISRARTAPTVMASNVKLSGAVQLPSVRATGAGAYFYQWLKNGQPVLDATNAVCNLTRVPFSDNGAQISVRVTNVYGAAVTSGLLAK